MKKLGIWGRACLASGPVLTLLHLLGTFPLKSLLGWVLFHHFRLILKILRKIFPNYFISISFHFPFCFLHNIYLYHNNCICLLDYYLSSLLSFKLYEHKNLVTFSAASFQKEMEKHFLFQCFRPSQAHRRWPITIFLKKINEIKSWEEKGGYILEEALSDLTGPRHTSQRSDFENWLKFCLDFALNFWTLVFLSEDDDKILCKVVFRVEIACMKCLVWC